MCINKCIRLKPIFSLMQSFHLLTTTVAVAKYVSLLTSVTGIITFINCLPNSRRVASNGSHLEGSSTSVDRPGYCHSPVLVVENVDVRQPILLDISSDSVHRS